MTEIDTAAIQDYHHCSGGYGYGCDDGTIREQCLVTKLCDALQAARAELRLKDMDARDMDEYDTRWFELHERAEAAEARIAAALAILNGATFQGRGQTWDEEVRRALTGGES